MLIKKMAPLVAALVAGGIAVAMAQASTIPTAHTASFRSTNVVKSVTGVGSVTGEASCPTGHTFISGGGYQIYGSSATTTIENRPSVNTGWIVKVHAPSEITLVVWAVCGATA
jgi:hypothetical protein